jgi:prepilin-type N-terminal cleavage/methylation domain-containing protein/prepilin-type processing-associated H-X9-DG protein
MKRPKQGKKGFTLVELLTVIVIIAILIALLFPVLTGAMERGNQSRCLSNLKQWGAAMTTYLSDRGGVFPGEGALGSQIQVGNTNAWFNVLAPYLGEVSLEQRAVNFSKKQPRPRDGSIYTCPTANEKDLAEYVAANGAMDDYADPYMSYSYNLWIDHGNRRSENPGSSTGFGTLLRLSQILKPAKFVVFGEVNNEAGNCISYFLAYRHARDSVNLCFADGHAGNYLKEVIYSTLSGLAAKNDNKGGIIWNPEGTPPQTDPSF